MEDPIEAFRQAILTQGLTPPDTIEPGRMHRFPGYQKSAKNRAGWCRMFTDRRGGVFGDHSSAIEGIWQEHSDKPYTHAERQAQQAQIEADLREYALETAKRHQAAAQDAHRRWQAATSCTHHPYLEKKRVQAYGARIDADGNLLVPMRDADARLWNVERINPNDGSKKGLFGGRRAGLYFSIAHPNSVLIVCEGYATGASIHGATGQAVAIAFDCGNLQAVATALRAKFPELKIIMAADDDHLTAGNPGMTKATAAALAIGAYLAVPEFFGHERSDKDTDFNDLHHLGGLEAVKACIDRAVLVKAESGAGDDASSAPLDAWPALQALVAPVTAQAYPLDALPESVRCAVDEVAGFVKAPVPLIAQSALAALSMAIQVHSDVERDEGLSSPCSLFMWAIADSGERKSSCDGYFTKAIREYEARERDRAVPLIQAFETDLDAWKAQRSGIQEKIKFLSKEGKPTNVQIDQLHDLDRDKPKAPRVPRLIYSDASPEGLALELVKSWPSGGILSTEAGVVLGGYGMGKDVAMRNMARLNQLWDGMIPDTTRASTESYRATKARLTVSLQVQEATLRTFFDSTKGLARGSGFLARFLVAWPASTMGTRMFTPAPVDWPALTAFNSRLTAILDRQAPIDDDGRLTPGILTLAPDAKSAWVEFHNQIEAELTSGRELFDVRDVASKTADNAARLAALFHVFNGGIGAIDANEMASGVRLALWHLLESQRFLAELAMPAELANPMRLESWLLDYCRREGVDKVPTKAVQQFGPGGLREKAVIDATVRELAELGRAQLIKDGKKKLIQLNPALLAAAS
jgi:putative DNA primase/helicase